MANSRMKDFHDLRALSQLFPFDGEVLAEAIVRTFERRKTAFPIIAAPPNSLKMNRSSFSGSCSTRRTGSTSKLLNSICHIYDHMYNKYSFFYCVTLICVLQFFSMLAGNISVIFDMLFAVLKCRFLL